MSGRWRLAGPSVVTVTAAVTFGASLQFTFDPTGAETDVSPQQGAGCLAPTFMRGAAFVAPVENIPVNLLPDVNGA